MKTKLDRRELSKVGIFLSVLMVLFGFGNYYAAADLYVGDLRFDQREVWRLALVWLSVGISGLAVLVYNIVQFRKSKEFDVSS